MLQCSIPECDRVAQARGWCKMHSGARPDPGRRRVHRGRMTRLILTLILAVAISAAVLLFGVLWESDATDYPEGNIHD